MGIANKMIMRSKKVIFFVGGTIFGISNKYYNILSGRYTTYKLVLPFFYLKLIFNRMDGII